MVLGFGAGQWDLHHHLGLWFGPAQQAGPAQEAAKGLHGSMAKCLDPRQGHLQVVHLPILLWGCEVVSAERVQQQGDEQVEHLGRSRREGRSINELSPSMAPQVGSWMAGYTHLGLSLHPWDAFSLWGRAISEESLGNVISDPLVWIRLVSMLPTAEEGRPCLAEGR